MNIYAFILARGGSKTVPGKNIQPLAGKPLIMWTIEEAKKSSHLSNIIVNTDNEEIACIAKKCGAEIFMRPKELAKDLTEDLPVFQHHLRELEKQNNVPDMIVDLRATAPLRRANRIDEGIELLMNIGPQNADSVRAVTEAAKHPYKMWYLKKGMLNAFLSKEHTGLKEPYNSPRQVLPEVYQNNGCMNAFWPKTVLEKNSVTGDRIAGYVMEDWESINIDTEIDFIIAEELMRRHPL